MSVQADGLTASLVGHDSLAPKPWESMTPAERTAKLPSYGKYVHHAIPDGERIVYKQCRVLPKEHGQDRVRIQYVKSAGKNYDDMSLTEKVLLADPAELSPIRYPETGLCDNGEPAEARWGLYKHVFEGVDMDDLADERNKEQMTANWERGLSTEGPGGGEVGARALRHGKNALDEKKVNHW